jgi:hypothetical protein
MNTDQLHTDTTDEATVHGDKNMPVSDELTGLKSKNAALIGENTKYKNSFKQFGGVEAALQRLAELEAKTQEIESHREAEAIKAGHVDALKSSYEKKLADVQKANEALSQRFVRAHVDKLIADAVSAEKGSLKLLGPHLAASVTGVMDKDGEIQVQVKGLDGTPLQSVEELVKALKADAAFGPAFEANDVVGAGVRTSSAKASANPFADATQDVNQQIKLIGERPDEATRLALAAGWAKHRITWAAQ